MSLKPAALAVTTVLLTTGVHADPFCYKNALTRGLSPAFEKSLKQEQPLIPIDLALATKQHEDYIHLLKQLIPNVISLPGDEAFPDCNFIEDTAIIVNDILVLSRPGAASRQGEVAGVAAALAQIPFQERHEIKAPATMDGGDVLFTKQHLFIGLSKRTNAKAIEQLGAIFSKVGISVIGIPVNEGLHLKSLISLLGEKTLLVSDEKAGHAVKASIAEAVPGNYQFVMVPHRVCANVVRIKDTVIIQDGYPECEAIIRGYCYERGLKYLTLNMSELIKADGALTCGSLLF